MAVNSVSLNRQVMVNRSPKFTSNPTDIKTETQKNKEDDKSTLLWAGLAGLAAIAVAGVVYGVTRGRGSSNPVTQSVEKPAEQIKEMAIDMFKKAGNKFEKGKAITANKTPYTGTLTHINKDGNKFVMEYKDGILQKSAKLGNDGKTVSEKIYTYGSDNKISKIIDNNVEIYSKEIDLDKHLIIIKSNGKNAIYDADSKKILRANGKDYYYDKQGKLKYTRDDNSYITEYYPNGKIKFSQDEFGAKFYNEKGEELAYYRGNFLGKLNSYKVKYPNRNISYELGASAYGDPMKTIWFHSKDGKPLIELYSDKTGKSCKYYSKNGRLFIEDSNAIVDICHGTTPVATFNIKTDEVIIKEDGLTKESVLSMMKEITAAVNSVKKEHREALRLREVWRTADRNINKTKKNKGFRASHQVS